MEKNKPICIEVDSEATCLTTFGLAINYRVGFTTNKNYRGHTKDDVPVYINRKLNQGEVKNIMTQDFKKLNDGKYLCRVEQVIRKHGKDLEGNEDKTKDIVSLELNVKDQDRFYYINFCVKGYGQQQMEIALDNLNNLMNEFNINVIEDLVGKEGILTAKTKPDGNTGMYLNAPKEFYDWNKTLKFDCEARFDGIVKRFYKLPHGNKYVFVVEAEVESTKINEYCVYDLDNQMKSDSFNWVLGKLKLTLDDADKDLVDKKCQLVIKRTTKNEVVYFNKRVGFPKVPKRVAGKW